MGLEALVLADEWLQLSRRSFPSANFVPQFTVMVSFAVGNISILLCSFPWGKCLLFPGLTGPGVGWNDIGIMTVSWRELGLHISDGQEKISCRDPSVCKDPFAVIASHPSLLAHTASKERGSKPSTVEGVFFWGATRLGQRAIFVPWLCLWPFAFHQKKHWRIWDNPPLD